MNSPLHLPFVSIIIPVYNDGRRLAKCLEALARQDYPDDRYEIIVVDNNSSQDIISQISAYQNVVFCRETVPGSYRARNKGISLARGDVFAFTDSDCTPTGNWLGAGVASLLSTPDCGLVGGKIQLYFRQSNKPNPIEFYDSITFFDQAKYINQLHFAATANAFTRRSVVDDVGGFNVDLKSGGDFEWGRRIYQQGYAQIYCEAAAVCHPARHSLKQMINKVRRHKGGMVARSMNHDRGASALSAVLRKFSPPIQPVIKKITGHACRRYARKKTLFLLLLLLHYIRVIEELKLHMGVAAER